MTFSLQAQTQTALLTDQKFLEEARQKNEQLLRALVSCERLEIQLSHAVITKHPLISKVHGPQKDQSCLFTQTLPHGALKTCRFTRTHREQIQTQGQRAFIRAMTDPKACTETGHNP